MQRSSVDVKCLLLSRIYGDDGEDDNFLRRLDCLLVVVGVDGDETGVASPLQAKRNVTKFL